MKGGGEGYQAGWNTFGNEGLNVLLHPRHGVEIGFVHAAPDGTITWRYGYNVGQPLDPPPLHPLHRDTPGLGECRALERDRNLAYAVIRYRGGAGWMTVTFANRHFDNVVMRCAFDGDVGGQFYLVAEATGDPAIPAFRLDERGVAADSDAVRLIIRAPERERGAHFFDDERALAAYLATGEDEESLGRGRFAAFPVGPRDEWLSVLLSARDVRLAAIAPRISGGEGPVIEANRALFERYSTTAAVGGKPGFERAILAPVYWNLSWDRRRGAPYLPVSKSWVAMMERIAGAADGRGRGPLIFQWDTAFAALSLAPFDATLAAELLNGLFAHQRPDGSLPQLVVGDRRSPLGNPPVVFLACQRVHLHLQNERLLREWFAALDRLFAWLDDRRAGSAEGRMAWGAPAADAAFPGLTGKVGCAYESGMDDSPAWSEAAYDPETGTLDIDSAGFTALACHAASIMARMADALGLPLERARYAARYARGRRALLSGLFDRRTGLFRNRRRDGAFSERLAPDCLFPLLVGRLDPGYVDGPVALLHDPAKFGGPHPIPSLARDDAEFDGDGDYWRGRIWPPLNYLVHLALLTQRRAAESWALAARSFDLFAREFEAHGHIHENLSAETGWGEPRPGVYARSAPMYSWGNLMGLMLLEEVFSVGWGGRLDVGSHRADRRVEFRNIKVGGTFYSVDCSPQRTRLERNRAPFVTAAPAARLLGLAEAPDRLAFRLLGNGRTEIRLHRLAERAEVHVSVDGRPAHYFNMPRPAPVVFTVDADPRTPRAVTVTVRR